MVDAAIAADMSLQIKSIPSQGLNLGPLTQKAETLPLTIPYTEYAGCALTVRIPVKFGTTHGR